MKNPPIISPLIRELLQELASLCAKGCFRIEYNPHAFEQQDPEEYCTDQLIEMPMGQLQRIRGADQMYVVIAFPDLKSGYVSVAAESEALALQLAIIGLKKMNK